MQSVSQIKLVVASVKSIGYTPLVIGKGLLQLSFAGWANPMVEIEKRKNRERMVVQMDGRKISKYK